MRLVTVGASPVRTQEAAEKLGAPIASRLPRSYRCTLYVSRAVAAAMDEMTHAPNVSAATGIHPFGGGPWIAAAMVGAKPASAKPICVGMAMPDRRTRVSNISP